LAKPDATTIKVEAIYDEDTRMLTFNLSQDAELPPKIAELDSPSSVETFEYNIKVCRSLSKKIRGVIITGL